MKSLFFLILTTLHWVTLTDLKAQELSATNILSTVNDTLVLQHKISKKERYIISGKLIKLKKKKGKKIKGRFSTIENNIITVIDKKGNIIQVDAKNIGRIKYFKSDSRRALGNSITTTLGVLGIAGAIIPLAMVSNSEESSGIGGSMAVGISLISGGIGTVAIITGILISGKSYNLRENWRIKIE